ncbi:AUGMIN subunit [Arachis hypogaea]|nr:AUGMIN subunit [Arachis hypogaea]
MWRGGGEAVVIRKVLVVVRVAKAWNLGKKIKCEGSSAGGEGLCLVNSCNNIILHQVLEQILGVLSKLVKDLKLDHQHKYDELQKTWLCKRCETMSAKLSQTKWSHFVPVTIVPQCALEPSCVLFNCNSICCAC